MALLKDWQKTLARGSFWLTLVTFGVRVTSLIYMIVLARLMPQREIGLFYFAFSVVSMIAIFSDLGLGTAIQRYLPFYETRKQFGRVRKLIRLYAMVGLIISSIIAAGLIGLSLVVKPFLLDPEIAGILALMALYLPIAMIFGIPQMFLMSKRRVREAAIGNMVQDLSKLVLTIALFLVIGLVAGSLALALLASLLVGTAYLVPKALREWRHLPHGGAEKLPLREIMFFGLVMVVISTLLSLAGYTDRILMGLLIEPGTAAVQIAIYSVATSLAAMLVVASNSIGATFLPVVSGICGKREPMRQIRESCSLAVKLTLFATIPLFLFFVAFAPDIIGLLYGAAYVSGALPLVIFSCGIMAIAFTGAPRNALAGLRRIDLEFRIGAVGAVSSIALNVLLIPGYGITGAASATAVSFMLMNLLAQYYARKVFGFRFPAVILKHVAAAAVTLAIMLLLQPFMADFFSIRIFAYTSSGVLLAIADKLTKVVLLGFVLGITTLLYFALLSLIRGIEKTEATLFAAALRKARVPGFIVRAVSSAMRL